MKSRVLIDGRLSGYRAGGIANYIRQIARNLPAHAPDLDVVVAVKRELDAEPFRTTRVVTPPHHRYERQLFGLESAVRRPDLIHATDLIQPVSRGSATVITIHDLAFLRNPNLITRGSHRHYGQVVSLARRVDAIVAVSEWTRSQVINLPGVDESRVYMVHNGVDHSRFGPNADGDQEILCGLHPDLGLFTDSDTRMILFVGTIEPRKRLDLLLDVLERLRKERAQTGEAIPALVVVGQTGWLAHRTVQRIRALQRTGGVIWLRDVDDRELAALYRSADVLVAPSEDEGFGLPVLEAMASGTPVVVANNGALPEVAGDAGLIVNTDDLSVWSNRLGGLLSDEGERFERARSGIRHAARFSWGRTAHETAEVYRKVLRT